MASQMASHLMFGEIGPAKRFWGRNAPNRSVYGLVYSCLVADGTGLGGGSRRWRKARAGRAFPPYAREL